MLRKIRTRTRRRTTRKTSKKVRMQLNQSTIGDPLSTLCHPPSIKDRTDPFSRDGQPVYAANPSSQDLQILKQELLELSKPKIVPPFSLDTVSFMSHHHFLSSMLEGTLDFLDRNSYWKYLLFSWNIFPALSAFDLFRTYYFNCYIILTHSHPRLPTYLPAYLCPTHNNLGLS